MDLVKKIHGSPGVVVTATAPATEVAAQCVQHAKEPRASSDEDGGAPAGKQTLVLVLNLLHVRQRSNAAWLQLRRFEKFRHGMAVFLVNAAEEGSALVVCELHIISKQVVD
jgi:hypothetical protein